ncbi:hypothetical protein [Ruminococcus sp. XPD3002]|uniref:hypothetical protein n=1 Tax=Ruminococcus sp. XPD3002 TaxID=1452269 RepID=UPI0009116F12|nr:hypothetical protein SAMN04487832_1143 [Ruminococcus flavefaciens]
MATLKNVFFAYLLDDTHYSIGEEMNGIIDNEMNDEYPIKQKSPSPGEEHLSFLPDEGDHIIIFTFLHFHADRHTGFEPELQIIIVHSHFFKQLLYETAVKH